MFFNKKKIILIYLLILLPEISTANIKENIIYNLQNTQNLILILSKMLTEKLKLETVP